MLMAFGVVQEGFKTEEECRGTKGLGDPALKKLNSAFQVRMGNKLGLPSEAIVISMDCLDSTKLPAPDAAPTKPAAPKGESL